MQSSPQPEAVEKLDGTDWFAALMAMVTAGAVVALAIAASVFATQVYMGSASRPGMGDTATIAMLAMQATVIALTLAVARSKGDARRDLWLVPAASTASVVRVALVGTAFLAISTIIAFTFFRENIVKDLANFRPMLDAPTWPLAVLAVVVGAPVSEELLFRGYLLPALMRFGIGFVVGTLATVVMWTLLHLGYSLAGLAEVFAAGLLLSWALRTTGSLYVPVAVHAIYNAAAMAIMFIMMP